MTKSENEEMKDIGFKYTTLKNVEETAKNLLERNKFSSGAMERTGNVQGNS